MLTTNDSPQWVPCSFIKPIVELIKSLFSQIFCCSIIEIRIKFMDDTFKSQHRKQSCRKRYQYMNIVSISDESLIINLTYKELQLQ